MRRLGAVLALLLGALAPAALVAGPAAAVAPVGGCWVWYSGTPASNISSALAPWSDTTPNYTLTLAPTAPAPGETVTITLTYDKGPKNGGPGAAVTGRFDFDVNGQTVSGTKDFGTVAGGAAMPGATVTAQFVAAAGDNDVVFEGASYRASAFDIQIDCNGQTSGSPSGNNPRTAPLPTNVTATVVGTGTPVTPSLSPSASPSVSPSASPSASVSPSASETKPVGAGKGTPAKGRATFACTLNPLGTQFDYAATITVSGYREAEGDPVSLSAKLTELPGIAPLPIDGQMDVTLDVTAGDAELTLKGGKEVQVPTKQPVPVPTLSGDLDADEDSMEIGVAGFTFDFPALEIDAVCTAPAGAVLGTMKVGAAPADDEPDPVDDGGGSGGGSGVGGDTGGLLPKTGGPEILPVLGLLAGALVLLGAGALVLVPGSARPYRRRH